MKILFYRYNSICEPDVIEAFQKLGLTVIEETTQMRVKDTTPMQTVEAVSRLMDKDRFLFVFSINFFPALSEVCRIYDIPYVCWSVDVPVMELFSPAFSNKCNRIFLFDRSQYEYFRDKNPGNVFYLPLATNTARWDRVISSAGSALHNKFASDISFIGSLYNEKNPFPEIKGLSEYTRGYLEGIMEAQSQLWGVNFLESMLTDEVMAELDPLVSELHGTYCSDNADARRYLIAHTYLGSQLAVNERLKYLGALSEHFDLDLYTLSDASQLQRAHVHPNGANTLTEMPIIFHNSRINMNITMRPIASGLSLRLYDICGCGGFLLTNYQEELPELYEPGREAETFSSVEEMLDKAGWYLEHEDERKKIALAGCKRTGAQHTYDKRIAEMIRMVNSTM